MQSVSYWRVLHSEMSDVVAKLNAIDIDHELLPRIKLHPIMATTNMVLKRIRGNNMSKLGKHNIARDVAFVLTSLASAYSALEDDDLPPNQFREIVSKCTEKFDALLAEIAVHQDYKESIARPPVDALLESVVKKTEEEIHHEVRSAKTFDSFTDAMKHAMKVQEKQNEPQLTNLPRADSNSLALTREQHLFSGLQNSMTKTLAEVKEKLNEHRDAAIVFIKCPVVIISEKQIPLQNLRSANIEFKTINFPGIQFGANPGGRHEFNPYAVVLYDQLLAALPQGTRKPSGDGFDDPPIPLTREHIPAILKTRTGRQYVDVLQDNHSMLASRAIPGFKMVWLMSASIFSKLGTLSIREVGLPFA